MGQITVPKVLDTTVLIWFITEPNPTYYSTVDNNQMVHVLCTPKGEYTWWIYTDAYPVRCKPC